MALTEGDRAIIREEVWTVVTRALERQDEHFNERLKLHAAECPVGRQVATYASEARGMGKLSKVLVAVISAVVGAVSGLMAAMAKH
jgi:hypothetical protein